MLAAVLLTVGGLSLVHAKPASAAVACSATAAAQHGITVVPSHGQAFYIDTGVTPRLDAGYVGYRVTNGTGSTQKTLWTTVTDFTGGIISLANPLDYEMQLPSLANGSTGVSYFMLKASAATTASQKHTVRVYDRRPSLAGATVLYECDYTFTRVKETIKAAANKLEDTGLGSTAAIEVSDTSPELGQTVTITVEGRTGTIGAGSAPDNSIIWLTPAAYSTWPTRALRLEGVSVLFDANGNFNQTADQVTFTDRLLISNASTVPGTSYYRASYTFRVVGRPTATVKTFPVAQISSGTQVKHTDPAGAIDVSFSTLAVNASLLKSVTATTGLTVCTYGTDCPFTGGEAAMRYVAVPYRLTGSSTTATTLNIDEFVDRPVDGLIFKTGSAKITDIGRTNVALPDPVYLASEATASPRPLHFAGPFQMNSTTSAILDYTVWVPTGTHSNIAYATVGDLVVGANSAAMSRVTVTSNGTATITAIVDTVGSDVTVTTDSATAITTGGAVLNGTVDPNGASPLTGTFEYGTSPTLAAYSTVTASTPASGVLSGLVDPTALSYSLTGLSSGTTYYYRAVAGSAAGQIMSFTTAAVAANPTVTTTVVSGVSTSGATLNGSVNPNMTNVAVVQFIYGTSPTLTSGNSTVTQWDADTALPLAVSGSSVQQFSQAVTGLTASTTYYYKIRACVGTYTGTTSTTVTCTGTVYDGAIMSFVSAVPPTVTTNVASSVLSTTATLNGTINANGLSTAATFEYGTVSDLSYGTAVVSVGTVTGSTATAVTYGLSGLTSSTTYYYRVIGISSAGPTYGSIVSFTTGALTSRTLTIDGSSYAASYAGDAVPPALTSTPSAGTGTKSYSSSTTGVCTVNATTGAVTFVSAGACTITASIAEDGTYAAATSTSISFAITAVSRTLAIDASSYTSSYSVLGTPPTITSTASAGTGTKSYTSTTTGVCTVDSSTGAVTFVAIGTCTIGASITADGTYDAATASTVSFSVTAAPRTLTLSGNNATYAFTDAAPTMAATASAGDASGTKSYISTTTGVCTVDGSTGVVTFVSVGACTIGASITASGSYDAATATDVSFTVTLAPRTLAIDGSSYVASYGLLDAPPTITSTPSVGAGTKSYTSTTTGVCTVNSTTGAVTFVSAGTCTIGASITSDGTYAAANATSVSFTLALVSRTHAIDGSSYTSSYSLTDTAPTITSTPSAGAGTKSYSSSTPSTCTVNSSTGLVAFVGPIGTCTITSTIAADGTYAAATSSSVSFTVGLAARTLTIDAASYVATYSLTDTAPTITATPSAGAGTKSYSSSTTGVCTVNSATGAVTFTGTAGTCTIGASITADGTYDSAAASTVSFSVTTAARTLAIDGSSYNLSYAFTDAAPSITATPSAGTGTRSYSSSTTDVCTVDSSTGAVTFVAVGTCTIGASITAAGTYDAATASTVSFSVTAGARTLAIDSSSYSADYGTTDTGPTITSTPTAGTGAKSYSSSTPTVCTVVAATGVVTLTGTAGTCTIGATIAAAGNYDAANATDINFSVGLTARTLTISPTSYVDSYLINAAAPTIVANPSAGDGTITYTSSTTGVCTVDGSTGAVTFVAEGTCIIGASIESDGTYGYASASTVSFAVNYLARTHAIDASSYAASYTLADAAPTITATPSAGTGTRSYSSSTTDVCTVSATTGAVTFTGTAGTCTIGASITADGTYAAATASSISFSVTLAPRTIAVNPASYAATYKTTDTEPTLTATLSAGGVTVSWASSTPAVCTVGAATGVVTFTGTAGTCSVTVSVTSDGTYVAATSTAAIFSVTTPSSGGSSSSRRAFSYGFSLPSCTATRSVSVSLTGQNISRVRLSNSTDFSGSEWVGASYVTVGQYDPITWLLPAGDGTKSVYAQFMSADYEISGTVTDDTVLNVSAACGTITPPSTPTTGTTPTSGTTPTTPTPGTETTQPATPADTTPLHVHIYIVNPDGTQRRLGTSFVRETTEGSGVSVFSFEDSGSDMDFNDVVVRVDQSDPNNVVFTKLPLSASWHHVIRAEFYRGETKVEDRVLWADSHDEDGSVSIDRVSLKAAPAEPTQTKAVEPKSCQEVTEASDLQLRLFIINPDGTRRVTGTRYVKVTKLANGLDRYAFEDKGDDFDLNDAIVDVDRRILTKVTFTAEPLESSWHHVVGLQVVDRGTVTRELVLWQDSHQAQNQPRVINFQTDPSACRLVTTVATGDKLSSSCRAASPFTQALTIGSRGAEVMRLQEVLKCLGRFPVSVPASGYFGTYTAAGVRAARAAWGLVPMEAVGPMMRAKLNAL